jgi:hypothetical protein
MLIKMKKKRAVEMCKVDQVQELHDCSIEKHEKGGRQWPCLKGFK